MPDYSFSIFGIAAKVKKNQKSMKKGTLFHISLRIGWIAGLLLWGCAGGLSAGGGDDVPDSSLVPVWVVSHGWHTGIVLPSDEVPEGQLPRLGGPDEFRHMEFGWGDEQFYKAGGMDFWLALRALLWPTESVMHVVGFDPEPTVFFPASEVLRLEMSPGRLARLVHFIARDFSRDPAGEVVSRGPGLYGKSRFFRARKRYFFPETCNVWTARALGAAGCRVRPLLALTADGLMRQARRCGARPPPKTPER